MTKDYKKQYLWNKENKVFIGVNLMKNTDADIIGYIEEKVSAGETKQGIIKRSLRSTMQQEGYHSEEGSE